MKEYDEQSIREIKELLVMFLNFKGKDKWSSLIQKDDEELLKCINKFLVLILKAKNNLEIKLNYNEI